MSKILFDLNSVSKDAKIAVQGIKIFLNRNKDAIVTIIGNQNDLLTIKDNKRVNIYDFKTFVSQIDNKYKDIKDRSLALAISLLSEDKDYVGLVTYSKKEEVRDAVSKYIKKKVDSPMYVATFANYKTHRITCIGDLGYKDNPSNDDYVNYLELMSNYMKKLLKKDKVEFKLLTYDKRYKNPLVSLLKDQEGYKGEIEGKDLLKCDTDIVVGHPKEFLGIISGINHGISIYDEFINDQVNHHAWLRYFTYPMFKSVLRSFHFEIDQKLTSGGNILLGFDKNIIVIDPDTIKQGVQVSLDIASKLESL